MSGLGSFPSREGGLPRVTTSVRSGSLRGGSTRSTPNPSPDGPAVVRLRTGAKSHHRSMAMLLGRDAEHSGARPSPPTTLRSGRPLLVWLAAGAAVALRLPLLGAAPSPDEAGFLAVGAQWRPGGTSLYGDYWVDRPPLLITIFRLAAEVGGLVPLRLIGCLATVLVVLGVAHTARLMAGPRAARWAALVAAALCVSPLTGAVAVNGELLSAPFVAWGVAAMFHAVRERAGQRALVFSLMAGAALTASLMVKPNIADVGVFTAALTLIAWQRGDLNRQ